MQTAAKHICSTCEPSCMERRADDLGPFVESHYDTPCHTPCDCPLKPNVAFQEAIPDPKPTYWEDIKLL